MHRMEEGNTHLVEQSRGSIRRQAYRSRTGPLKGRKGFGYNIRKLKAKTK